MQENHGEYTIREKDMSIGGIKQRLLHVGTERRVIAV
jgi:hypothetical protein